jgi:hypothetical protein
LWLQSWLSRPRLLPLRRAAEYLGISPYTLRDWLAAGLIPSIQIDLPAGVDGRRGDRFRKTLVDLQDLDQFIAQAKHARLDPLPVKPPRKKLS